LSKQTRRLGQLHDNDLTHQGIACGAFGNQDVLSIAAVFRGDQPNTTFLQQAPNNGLQGPLKNLHDPAFGSAFAIQTSDFGQYTISVQDRPHFIGWQIHIGLSVLSLHKSMPIAMAFYSALELVRRE
jgi:hypothetical protein